MRKLNVLPLVLMVLFSMFVALPIVFSVTDSSVELKVVVTYAIPPTDNGGSNRHYKLLRYHSYSTINYYVNTANSYGFTSSQVVYAISASVNAWDSQTSYQVFTYKGTTSNVAGEYDGYNVISWGDYGNAGVIAVTMSWVSGRRVLEVDCMMNKGAFSWSLTGESGKMDVQNIMTHELGHFCGLADLYNSADYWLTMYGYANYGEIYKRTLGQGDILGLRAFYGM